MSRKMPFRQERSQHHLRQPRWIAFDSPAKLQYRVEPCVRHHHITKPQRRKEALVKCSQQENMFSAADPLHSWRGPAEESKLAVIIVFDDQHTLLPGPSQQVQP